MSPRKRPRSHENDENIPPTTPRNAKSVKFIDCSAPKKPRLSAKNGRHFTPQDIQNMRESYTQQAPIRVAKEMEEKAAAAARGAEVEAGRATDRIEQAWSLLRPLFPSMHDFLRKLLTTRHPVRSSQVSNLLTFHGHDLLNLIRDRHSSVANDWAISTARQLVSSECDSLSQHFKPAPGTPVSEILHRFSLGEVLSDAQTLAPTLFQILQQAGGMLSTSQDKPSRKHPDLVLATTLCMLAKARNDHASDFPTTMCMYFLACGTSRSVFNVLNHAGVTLSYTQAIAKIKQLGGERLTMMREIARSRAFMVIWDNLNIAFKVSEQRHDSKDHFDNGTTATLLWNIIRLFCILRNEKTPGIRHAHFLD